METYHPAVQAAIHRLFIEYEKENRKFCSALLSGRAVTKYANTTTAARISDATLNNGMYLYHDLPLTQCLQKHTERWQDICQSVADITKTFFSELSKRCLSVAEIVMAMLLLKLRYFTVTRKTDLIEKMQATPLPHYNPNLQWKKVFTLIDMDGVPRQKVACPEMSQIFLDSIEAIIDALHRDPMCFESSIDLLQQLRTGAVVTDAQAKQLSLGGLTPKAIAAKDTLQKKLVCYQQFESGDFAQLLSLLLTVQLSIRVNLLLERSPEFSSLNPREREVQFGDLRLQQIFGELEKNPFTDLFRYPVNFKHKKRLLDCELIINNAQIRTVLDTEVLYYLFGEEQPQLFVDALAQGLVLKKKKFLQKGEKSATVDRNGIVMPICWSKNPHFKNLRA